MNSAMFGIAVTNAVYYYWYEFVKDVLQGPTKKVLSVSENMLTGAIAGAFTSILTNPIWVINVRNIELRVQLERRRRKLIHWTVKIDPFGGKERLDGRYQSRSAQKVAVFYVSGSKDTERRGCPRLFQGRDSRPGPRHQSCDSIHGV
jgi:hypothetical protein